MESEWYSGVKHLDDVGESQCQKKNPLKAQEEPFSGEKREGFIGFSFVSR